MQLVSLCVDRWTLRTVLPSQLENQLFSYNEQFVLHMALT